LQTKTYLTNLVREMLQVDAGNRPSAQDLYVVFTILSDSKSPEKAKTDLMLVEKICRPLSENNVDFQEGQDKTYY